MAEIGFGEFLRVLRLRAGYGLRAFAEVVGMQPSNLSNIEHGRAAPPQDPDTLARIAGELGVERGTEEWAQLHDLAVQHKERALPPDVAAFAAEVPGIPALLRTLDDRRLSQVELRQLAQYVENRYRKDRM